jgi:hypothetical protein
MTTPTVHIHGGTTLCPSDLPRLERLLDRVRDYMLDASKTADPWRTLPRIQSFCAPCTEASVSARLRDLRRPEHGGFIVERRQVPNAPGLFEYRVVNPERQRELSA